MIQILISTDAQKIVKQLDAFPDAMKRRIGQALDKQNQLTIARAQGERMSGPRPEVLGVVTNRLRGSLNASKAVISAGSVDSTIGTNVAYAQVHEHGIDALVTVRAFTRNVSVKRETGGGLVFDATTGRIRKERKKTVRIHAGTSTVQSFIRHMKMPARPYLWPTVQECELDYSRGVSEAIRLAWNGGRN